ncbi:MAG: PDZ domain-containing protein [Nannocystaceae bacterium]
MDKRPLWPIPVGIAAWIGVGVLAYQGTWWPLYVVAAVSLGPGLFLLAMVLFTCRAKRHAAAVAAQPAAPPPAAGPIAQPPVQRASKARTNARNAGRRSKATALLPWVLLPAIASEGCNKIEQARERRRAREAAERGDTGGEPPAPANVPEAPTAPSDAKTVPVAAEPIHLDAEQAALDAALRHAIVRTNPAEASYRVDPFVAALIYEQLRAGVGPTLTPLQAPIADGPSAGYRVGAIAHGGLFERLGLREGDVIVALGGRELHARDQISLALDGAGNQLTVKVFRDGETFVNRYQLTVALAWTEIIAAEGDSAPAGAVEPAAAPDDEPATDAPPSEPSDTAGADAPAHGGGGSGGGGGSKPPEGPSKPAGGGKPVTPTPSGPADVSCESSARCTVREAYFDKMVGSPAALQAQATIVPAIQDDIFSGYKLKSVKAGSAVAKLGFRAGDKITHVNGKDLTDDLQAAQVYFALGSTDVFKVRYERGGSKLVKTIVVD